ncbi:MAG: ABC transporter permease [Acidobacteriia bacterium]|nr:ABC transporter permease [Terriglobia bacterium]
MKSDRPEAAESRAPRLLENVLQDVRYGLRVLQKNRGFSLAAILTLALGIGANAAIFSLVYGVLLRPLPYQNGGRLVVVHQKSPRTNQPNVPFSAQEIFDYRDNSHTLSGLVEHHTMNFLLLGKDSAERVNTAVVSANFFDVLGVQPLLGRTFVAGDEAPGSNAVLILSNEYWRTRHGADPNIVGTVFQMNNRPHTVIGVLPPIPQYPVENDVYMPTSQCPLRSSQAFIQNRRRRMMTAFARLKPGVPLEQAQADLDTIAARLERQYPDAYPKAAGYGIAVAPLQEDLTRQARTTFLVLLGAAGFVLLIACANVANLLLARLLKLERELAIRAALGAGKARLIRQLLTESVLLSLAGGAIGLAFAPTALALLVKFAERFTTRAAEIKIDGPVLLFTILVSLATGLLFGFAPAFSSSGNVGDALKQGNGRTTASRGGSRLRAVLVVSQVAVSFILLIGAGLMIRSFIRLQQVNPGFSADRVLTMRLSPNFSRYRGPEGRRALEDGILRKVRATTGVTYAALGGNFPLSPGGIAQGPGSTSFEIEGRPVSRGDLAPQVDTSVVTTQYFAVIRQPILAGRDFTEHDDANAPQVALINQTMARHRWPTEDPIGKRITFDQGQHWATIIGIVGDVKEYGLDREVKDEVYGVSVQNGFVNLLVVRTAGDPAALISNVRATLHDVDSQLAVDQVQTLERLQHESVASPRVTTILLGLFALLALIISASGIAAVMALSVTQRTNELGIRMALGASRESILLMVVRHGLLMALAGTVAGIAGAVAVTRLLATLLYGTSPTEISTFAGVSLLFLVVASVACLIPARAVTAIDPVIALRQD